MKIGIPNRFLIGSVAAVASFALAAGCASGGPTPAVGSGAGTQPAPAPTAANQGTVTATVAPAPAPPAAQPDADAYAAIHALAAGERSAIQDVDPQVLAIYSDFEVNTPDPSTIEFMFRYAQQVTFNPGEEPCDLFPEEFFAAFKEHMEQEGVVNPRITYVYYNADGSQICSITR